MPSYEVLELLRTIEEMDRPQCGPGQPQTLVTE